MQIALNFKAVQFGFVCADLKNVLMRKKMRTLGRSWFLCFSGNCKPSPLGIAFLLHFPVHAAEASPGIRHVAPAASRCSCVLGEPACGGGEARALGRAPPFYTPSAARPACLRSCMLIKSLETQACPRLCEHRAASGRRAAGPDPPSLLQRRSLQAPGGKAASPLAPVLPLDPPMAR